MASNAYMDAGYEEMATYSQRQLSAYGMDEGSKYFSIPVFFIIMREVVEIMIVLVIVYAYLGDNQLAEFKKYALAGCAVGVLLDLIIASFVIAIFYTVQENAFQGTSGVIFEGALMMFACVVLTVFGISMHAMFSNLHEKIERKLSKMAQILNDVLQDTANNESTDLERPRPVNGVSNGSKENSGRINPTDQEGWETSSNDNLLARNGRQSAAAADKDLAVTEPNTDDPLFENPEAKSKVAWGVFSVTFWAVFREGLECITFLAGLTSSYPPTSIPIAAIVGVIVGLTIGYAFFRAGKAGCDMQIFVNVSIIFLFFMAAGMLERAFGDWVLLGMAAGPRLWDIRACCSQTKSAFWGFMRLIFGYNDRPTFVEFFIYFLYWAVVYVLGRQHNIWKTFNCFGSCLTRCKKPSADEALTEEGLPKYWASATDAASGLTYYYNRVDGRTAWVMPADESSGMVSPVDSSRA